MTQIKRYFSNGVMNKDIDERIVPNGQFIHAENIRVNINEGGSGGVVTNVKGTEILQSLDSLGSNHTDFFPSVIGEGRDDDDWCIYVLFKTNQSDLLVEYNYKENILTRVLEGDLGLDRNFLVNEIRIIKDSVTGEKYAAWTDFNTSIKCININRCKTFEPYGFVEDDICLIKRPPSSEPRLELSHTTTFEENFIEEKFLHFATRFQYLDGEYSALSAFTLAAFEPEEYNIRYDSMDNDGMKNKYNQINIYFNTGSKRVKSIDLVYKESGSNTIYKVQSFNKQKEGWGNNEEVSFQFFNNKTYSVLPEKELYRLYDNVPLRAKDLTVINGSIVLSNYVQGYDLLDKNGEKVDVDFDLEIVNSSSVQARVPINTSSDNSLMMNFEGVNFERGNELIFDLSYIEESNGIDVRILVNYVVRSTQSNFTSFFNVEGQQLIDHLNFEINEKLSSLLNNSSIPINPNSIFDSITNFGVANLSENTLSITNPILAYKTWTTNPTNYNITTLPILKVNDGGVTKILLQAGKTKRSLKSNRDYEVGIVYLDGYNRSTSTLVCKNNTVFNPIKNSALVNKLALTLKNNAPYWAKFYKLVLKAKRETYHNFFGTVFYEEGIYRWIKVEGANKNKIEEGDMLVVKSDMYGLMESLVKTKVLEVVTQSTDFIEDNELEGGSPILEKAGLYIKIKPEGFSLDFSVDTMREFVGGSHLIDPPATYTSPGFYKVGSTTEFAEINGGSKIKIYIQFKRNKGGSVSGFNYEYDKEFTVQGNYPDFKSWFEAEVEDLGIWGKDYTYFGSNEQGEYGTGYGFNATGSQFFVRSNRGGSGGKRVTTTVKIELFAVDGNAIIFETDKKDDSIDLYYETGQTFEIKNNLHQGNVANQTSDRPAVIMLDVFNCFCFGNGAESYRIKDRFNGNALTTDLRPTTVLEDEYKQEHKFSSITWSGIYEEETGYNSLNEFNPALANFKKLEDSYGEIQRSVPKDNNLIVFQNDKVSNVLHGKKALFNSDGSTNIGASDLMFGDQMPYNGDYGCSNPESIYLYRNAIFFFDKKRGIPLKITEAGINDIYGYYYEGENIRRDMMSKEFISICRENYDSLFYGAFDMENREYILTIRPKYSSENYFTKTLAWNDRGNGWSCEYSFVSDQLINLNNRFIGIKDGVFYEHNISDKYNTFYGMQYESRIKTLFNDAPSDTKIFHSLNIEGNIVWDSYQLKTNLTQTLLGWKDFRQIEDEFYAAIKRNTNHHNNSQAVQGIGEVVSVENNQIIFPHNPPHNVSVGDKLFINNDDNYIGKITNIESNKITVDATDLSGIQPVDFAFAKKNAIITGGNMRGYYMEVDMSINTNKKVELYSINAEITKSNP